MNNRLFACLYCCAVFVLVAIVFSSVASAQPAAAKGRVVILGFDGVDPGIVSQMFAANELPNLARLKEEGTFQPLGSSNPPQSPTAWSNFATCRTPVNHGIYDFLRRNPANYFPAPGFGLMKQPELAPDGALAKAAEYLNYRKGDSFWKAASDQGARVKALIVPFAYPAEDLCGDCRQLCGLDVPDIRGTQSTYFAFSEDFPAEERVAGGMRLPLKFTGDSAAVSVPGIALPGKKGEYAQVPVTLNADRAANSVGIEVQGVKVTLKEGEWSEWMEWSFALSPQYSVRAVSRFYLMQAASPIRLYMTCLQMHPRAPLTPISTPASYASELADRYGLYKTIGWACDTKALQKDDMTDDMFLEDAKRTMEWNRQLTLDEMDRGNVDLLIAAWTETDRVSHMFWRFRDPKHPLYTADGAAKYGQAVEDTYRIMDSIVGDVVKRLQPNDLLMILSDHGFHSFRTGFSVNTWLARNGYLTIKGQTDPATAYTDEKYLQGFDWARTKAYALGLGMVFLNMTGREGQGIVPREEAPALLEELRTKLMNLTDPGTGEKVFGNVYVNVNPQGESVQEAPDIQLGYAEGYQTDKASAAGAAPKDVFSPNDDKWSGEHASSDIATTPGIFFSNKPVNGEPTLLDLGVTAIEYLGLSVPAKFEGKGLL